LLIFLFKVIWLFIASIKILLYLYFFLFFASIKNYVRSKFAHSANVDFFCKAKKKPKNYKYSSFLWVKSPSGCERRFFFALVYLFFALQKIKRSQKLRTRFVIKNRLQSKIATDFYNKLRSQKVRTCFARRFIFGFAKNKRKKNQK